MILLAWLLGGLLATAAPRPDDVCHPDVIAEALQTVGDEAHPQELHLALRELLRHREHAGQARASLVELALDEPAHPGWVDTYEALMDGELPPEPLARLQARRLAAAAASPASRDAALAELRARLDAAPDALAPHLALADGLLHAGRPDAALAVLIRAPDAPDTHRLRLLAALGSRAMNPILLNRLAVQAGLDEAPALGLEASQVLLEAGYPLSAEVALRMTDGTPDAHPEAVAQLARLLLHRGRPELAQPLLDALVSVRPDDVIAADLLLQARRARDDDPLGLPLPTLLARLAYADPERRRLLAAAIAETRRQHGDRRLDHSEVAAASRSWRLARLSGRESDPTRRFERALAAALGWTHEGLVVVPDLVAPRTALHRR